ncbi:Rhodanese-like domain-containing protein [Thelonectria olida]|uniref:M-phase inducer phosphatase n=1 Tax=Thelonectria olida TaxID=1576542 RepID=A0A9P9ALU5_9HYPO|nr:Rhodanese-like domain-containing protein [Thelonectria olida]
MPDKAETHDPILPHFTKPNEIIPRITKETLVGVLNGSYGTLFSQIRIIDCRFQHEYNGGHIDQALNYDDDARLTEWLFGSPEGGATLIFHCEYSVCRAPRIAGVVRDYDRRLNIDCYPNLLYENIYILDGGYRDFFASYPAWCSPRGYIRMADGQYWTTGLRQRLDRLKGRKRSSRSAWSPESNSIPPLRLNNKNIRQRGQETEMELKYGRNCDY